MSHNIMGCLQQSDTALLKQCSHLSRFTEEYVNMQVQEVVYYSGVPLKRPVLQHNFSTVLFNL